MKLTLISVTAAQGLFGLLSATSLLLASLAALDAHGGFALSVDAWGCVLAGLVFAMLAFAVRAGRLGVIAAQRLGVAALSVFLLSSLHQVWSGIAGTPGDVLAVASTSVWLLLLGVWMFVCMPRHWAAAATMGLAGLAAAFPWLSAAPVDPALRMLALQVLLAHAVLCAVLYGLAIQVLRLASVGRLAELGVQGAQEPVQSIEQFVSLREAGLRRLLRQAEQAHQLASQREAELRTMLDAFPGVVLRIENSGTMSYCNERAAALLGLSAADLEGRHARTLLGEDGYLKTCSRNLQIQASGLPASFEFVVSHPHGSTHELLMTQFVVAAGAPGGTASYQIGVDIGERKRAEAALSRAKADAERANQAKSRVMSSISHELRTPLNAVLGLAQMLRVQAAPVDSGQQRLHLEAIADAGKDLLALVDETLDLSRIDAGDMRVDCRPVNLGDLVHVVLGSMAALAAEQGVSLARPPSARGLWVQADPVRLRQVLLNLLSNAIKYNRRGGGVAVRVVRRGTDVQLVVQDTGVGMTLQQQAQLFQPFNRLGAEHSGVPGTGIGLSIAHGLVGLMKGRLDVRSQPGVGTEFLVWLPAVEAPPLPREPVRSAYSALDEAPGLHGTVLYVEDNEVNVVVFEACLARRPNVKLHVARTGAEALALVAREAVDLVVLDLNLPDQNGLDLADALRQHHPAAQVPLVLLTADATAATARRARAHGIDRIWHKPFDAARLLCELDELLKLPEAV